MTSFGYPVFSKMTESVTVKEWMKETREKTQFETLRDALIRVLNRRFPGAVTPEVVATINSQPDLAMLGEWLDEAASVLTFADFVAVLRR